MLRLVKPVGQCPKEGRGVALHEVGCAWIHRPEWAVVLPDMQVEPGVVHKCEVRTLESPVEPVSRDANPGGVVVGTALTLLMTGADNIEEVGTLVAHPRTGIVLIRNCVDSKLADERISLWLAASLHYFPERLGETVGATPDRNINWPVIFSVHRFDNMLRARRVVSFTNSLHPKYGNTRLHGLQESICFWPAF